MAEIIHIREIIEQREIARSRARDRQSLAQAVEILKENLRAVADEIATAPAPSQTELLTRAEHLIALIRYGISMMGEATASPDGGEPNFSARRG
ncbi:MAG TPA: hypothetical protein VEF03_05270 [Candidatus Binataceae bacterium]|nr:hypothetical protein [Candidatus Binataceae bacterium]